jgi:prolyl-tRNA synthetase
MSKKDLKSSEGITVSKEEDDSEWYSQVVQKAELVDYAPIKGFMIIRPRAYSIWEKIQEEFNKTLKNKGVKNVYMPMLIPDSFFKKEAEHAKGFSPELAYIKNTEDSELLALRPTSETLFYNSFSKWIRSHRDLPLKLNQWCNIIRWEVKQTRPFLRTREFLWQEGHCAFANKKDAQDNQEEMIQEYKRLIEDLLAIPLIIGEKSIGERFAGAESTKTVEALLPSGKALQCGTSHVLQQSFTNAFNISFEDENEKHKNVWATSWGISTRLIGGMVMQHSDNKGLVLPPNVANEKIVIIPILFEDTKEKVLKKSKEIENKLKKYNPILDSREEVTPGRKFNEWELKGIPLRIEIGPKDVEKNQVTIVRRDNSEKIQIKMADVEKKVSQLLENMQSDLFKKAKKSFDSRIDKASSIEELNKKINEKKMVKAYFINSPEVEDKIKAKTDGAASRIIENVKNKGKCILTGKETNTIGYFARAY